VLVPVDPSVIDRINHVAAFFGAITGVRWARLTSHPDWPTSPLPFPRKQEYCIVRYHTGHDAGLAAIKAPV